MAHEALNMLKYLKIFWNSFEIQITASRHSKGVKDYVAIPNIWFSWSKQTNWLSLTFNT